MNKVLQQTGGLADAQAANQAMRSGGLVAQQAAKAGVVFGQGEKGKLADAKEDKHLGNISLTVQKIKNALNAECKSPAGDVVQHSDYGGNPFGSMDYPLIFFIPNSASNFGTAEYKVATNEAELKPILREIQKQGYILKLNPAWSLPLF